jgi:hypothetical protein
MKARRSEDGDIKGAAGDGYKTIVKILTIDPGNQNLKL